MHPSGLLTPHTLGGYLPEMAARLPARRRRRAAARDEAVRPAPARRSRADRHAATRPGTRTVGGAEPALPGRAPRHPPARRSTRSIAGLRDRGRTRGRRRSRRDRDLGGAPLPDRAVSRSDAEPARRRLRRRRRASLPRSCEPSARRRPASASAFGCRPTPSGPPAIAQLLAAEEVDYLVARARRLVVLPRLAPHRPAAATRRRRDRRAVRPVRGRPRRGSLRHASSTSERAERLIADGRADAVGMTRGADRRSRAAARRPAQAGSTRLSAASAVTPASRTTTRARRSAVPSIPAPAARSASCLPCPRPSGDGSSSSAADPRASPLPWRRAAPGTTSILLERSAAPRRADRARRSARRRSAELAATFLGNANRQLSTAGVDVRLETTPTRPTCSRSRPTPSSSRPARVPIVTSACSSTASRSGRVGRPRRSGCRPEPASSSPTGAAIPVGSTPRSCSQRRAGASTLAVASVTVGETVHQYRRNLYLQRLYRAGVVILHHHELDSAARGDRPAAQRLRSRARARRSPRTRSCSRSAEYPRTALAAELAARRSARRGSRRLPARRARSRRPCSRAHSQRGASFA